MPLIIVSARQSPLNAIISPIGVRPFARYTGGSSDWLLSWVEQSTRSQAVVG